LYLLRFSWRVGAFVGKATKPLASRKGEGYGFQEKLHPTITLNFPKAAIAAFHETGTPARQFHDPARDRALQDFGSEQRSNPHGLSARG
jgi:hypothetical protein